jgi:tight adherence protein B
MRALIVGVVGIVVVVVAARAARRFAVVDRLRPNGVRVEPRGPVVEWAARLLDAAAIDVPVAHAFQLWGAIVAVAAILGLTLAGSVGASAAAAFATATGSIAIVLSLRGRRGRLVAAAVPPTIERVASELRAGGTIPTAIHAIARSDAVLASDFGRVDARVMLGASVDEALRAWARERDAGGVDVTAGALSMCAAFGGRSADALEGVASSLRDRLAIAAEARALSAQARMSALVVGGTPLLYLAWSALADRAAWHALAGTTTGRVCVLAGLGLETLGIWWMSRILRSGSVL